jgi:hypothetical protein
VTPSPGRSRACGRRPAAPCGGRRAQPRNRVAPGHPGAAGDHAAALARLASSTASKRSVAPAIAGDGGPSALAIVLLALGAVTLLAGAKYLAPRAIHHHPHVLR